MQKHSSICCHNAKKIVFIECHKRKIRATYDAILRKHELIGCHNKKFLFLMVL